MLAALRPVQLDDQVGKAVDDGGLLPESRRGIDHAEDAQPRGDPIQVAQLALQARKYRQRNQARRLLRLLERDIEAHFTQRSGERAVGILRGVS